MAELRDAYKAIKLLQDALSKSKADTASLRDHFKAQLEQYQLQVHALRDELAAKPVDEAKPVPCQHHGLGIEAAERKHALEVQALRDELALAHRYREEALAELAHCRASLVEQQNVSQNSARALKERQATHEAEVLGLQQTNTIVLLEKHVLQDEVSTLRTAVADHEASKQALEDHTRLLLLQQHTLQEQLALALEDRDAVRRVADALLPQVKSLKHELNVVRTTMHTLQQEHRVELQDALNAMATPETDKALSDVPTTLAALLQEKVQLQKDVDALRAFTHDHVQTTLASVQQHLREEWADFQRKQVAPLKTMAADLCNKVEVLEHDKLETATSLRTQWATLRTFCTEELAAFAEQQSNVMGQVLAQVATLQQASDAAVVATKPVDDATVPWSDLVATLLDVAGPFQKLVQSLSQLQSLLKTMAHHARALEDWSDAATQDRVRSIVLVAQHLVATTPPDALGETVAACHRAVHDQLYGWHEVQSSYVGPIPVFGIHSPEVDHIMTSWSATVAEQQAAKLWLSYVATGDIDGHQESSQFRFRGLGDDVKDAFLVLIVPVLQQRQGDHLHVRLRRHRPSTVSDETRWDLLLEVGALMRQSLSSESDDSVAPPKEAPSTLFLAIHRRLTELQQRP